MRLRTLDVTLATTAGRARGTADRAPLGLPPRLAVSRRARRRAGRRVGRGAPARPRRDHRRPRLASTRASRRCVRCSRGSGRHSSILGNHDVEHSRDPFSRAAGLDELVAGASAGGRERDRRGARPARADRRRRSRAPIGSGDRSRGRSWTRPPTCGSCCATSRTSSTSSRRGIRPRAQRAHARRSDLAPAGRVPGSTASRTRTRATRRASTNGPAGRCMSRRGSGTTFVPFRFFARPEATELVLQRR